MAILGNINFPSNLGLPSAVEIGEAVRQWEPDPTTFKLASLFPLKLTGAQEYVYNQIDSVRGMTKSYRVDGNVEAVGHQGRTPMSARPFFFRETGEIFESDFISAMSELSFNKLAGEELVMNFSRGLDLRCETRIEWCRAQVIAYNSITIDGLTMNYGIPGGNRPTAGVLWTDHENCDPVANIMAWLMNFRGIGGTVRCMYSRQVAMYLCQSEKVIDLYRGSGLAANLGPENVGQVLAQNVDGSTNVTFEIYDGGYLDEATGDYTPFFPDNRFQMIATPPNNQPLGCFFSTPSISNADENSFTPRPGKFVTVKNKLKDPKPVYTQTQGIYGGIALFHPKNVISAKVAN